jgi:hypothetical protein
MYGYTMLFFNHKGRKCIPVKLIGNKKQVLEYRREIAQISLQLNQQFNNDEV